MGEFIVLIGVSLVASGLIGLLVLLFFLLTRKKAKPPATVHHIGGYRPVTQSRWADPARFQPSESPTPISMPAMPIGVVEIYEDYVPIQTDLGSSPSAPVDSFPSFDGFGGGNSDGGGASGSWDAPSSPDSSSYDSGSCDSSSSDSGSCSSDS